MAIKATIQMQQNKPKTPFPCLMKSISTGNVFLFIEDQKAICIAPVDEGYQVGEITTAIAPYSIAEHWEPSAPVTLANDFE